MKQNETATRLFADYDSYHRTAGNQFTHALGIPLIVFSSLGLLANFHVANLRLPLASHANVEIELGLLAWAATSVYYVWVSRRIGLLFSLLNLVFWYFARYVPDAALWTCFIAGWVLQFIGHGVYEKRRPAFFKNLLHALIGPIWIFAKVFKLKP